jgi:hypothetical protein
MSWSESSLGMIAVISDHTRVKILELGDKILEESDLHRQKTVTRIQEIVNKDERQ